MRIARIEAFQVQWRPEDPGWVNAIVCGLIDPRMKIEIEVTARRRM